MSPTKERKPYESPAVVYEAFMEVYAATSCQPGAGSQIIPDILDPADTK